MQRYRFGQGTADFLVCRHCGVYLGAVIDTPRGSFGIANVHALRERDIALPAGVAVDYDSEGREQRIARREQVWTPAAYADPGAVR